MADEAYFVSSRLLDGAPAWQHFELFLEYVARRCIASEGEYLALHLGRLIAGRGS